MPKRLAISLYSIALLVIGLAVTQVAEAATEPQMLTGELWRTMSRDTKVAYIWGIGNLLELERTNLVGQSREHPTAERKSFFPYLARGLSELSINQIITQVDNYYMTYPNQLNRPVIDAIFQAIILPRLQAEKRGGGSR